MFYTYDQNNSGGSFDVDDMVTVTVIIEANSAEQANSLASGVGIYFGGVGDCSCCGDRWYSQWGDSNGDAVPSLHGNAPEMKYQTNYATDWVNDAKRAYCYVYYLNGDKVGYFRNPKTGEISIKSM